MGGHRCACIDRPSVVTREHDQQPFGEIAAVKDVSTADVQTHFNHVRIKWEVPVIPVLGNVHRNDLPVLDTILAHVRLGIGRPGDPWAS